jgi:hypothetical protein
MCGGRENNDATEKPLPDHTIRLQWIKAYPGEHWKQVREGLRWTFSFLGASLPKGSFDKAVPANDSSAFTLDFSQLGFSTDALTAIDSILVKLKSSATYRSENCMDLSRLVVLLIGESENYYAITGSEKTLGNFIRKHGLENPLQFGVTRSAVANHHRLIQFNPDTSSVLNFAFVAVESEDDLEKGTFHASVFEAFDIMPNGQLRFSVYDEKGERIAASPAHLGKAGKPAKCLWCHEIVISPLFVPNTPVAGKLTNEEFEFWRSAFQRNLDHYRTTLNDDIDYTLTQDHTFMEMLYISFMEPSLMRLSNEWQLSPAEAEKRMGTPPGHLYEEFPQMGMLYYRYYADSAAGVKDLRMPLSVREGVGEK